MLSKRDTEFGNAAIRLIALGLQAVYRYRRYARLRAAENQRLTGREGCDGQTK